MTNGQRLAHDDPARQQVHIESKIVVALERIAEAFRVLRWKKGLAYQLSPLQLQAMVFLLYHSRDKRSVSYLAREFNVTKATMSEAIRVLKAKKLVRTTPDKDDTRRQWLSLTAQGQEAAQDLAHFSDPAHVPIQHLSSTAKEQLLHSLLLILDYLLDQKIIALQRMCLSCIYFRPGGKNQAAHCALLQKALAPSDLRVDCPDHVAKTTAKAATRKTHIREVRSKRL